MDHLTDDPYNWSSLLTQTSYTIGNVVLNNKYTIAPEFQLARLSSLARVKVFNLQVVLWEEKLAKLTVPEYLDFLLPLTTSKAVYY